MMNSNPSSSAHSLATPRWFVGTLFGVSLAGFLDATYLTVKHVAGSPVTCTVLKGCEAVTTSRFATAAGIPVALLGALYYLVVLLLTIAYLDTKRSAFVMYAARLTVVGLLASLWFVFVQAFLVRAWCLYCLGSAVTSTVLFGASLIYFFQQKKYAAAEDR